MREEDFPVEPRLRQWWASHVHRRNVWRRRNLRITVILLAIVLPILLAVMAWGALNDFGGCNQEDPLLRQECIEQRGDGALWFR